MSFWEVLIILVVGLIVVGPERLPEALRNGMLWFGRLKSSISQTRAEFEQQLGVDEIRRELHNEQVMKSLAAIEELKEKTKSKMEDIDDYIQNEIKHIENNSDEPIEPHDAHNDIHDDDAEFNAGAEHDVNDAPDQTTPIEQRTEQ